MNYPHPIVLIQHMPATFTAAFASRLNTLCKIQVKEAQDGDVLQAGVAYLAPGGKQMMIDGRAGAARLRIIDGGDRMNYKPCVDVTFGSAAKVYGDKVLSMVLTGNGCRWPRRCTYAEIGRFNHLGTRRRKLCGLRYASSCC